MLAEFFERRKKQLAAERAKAIRSKPPTRTQVRNRMITYLKHMGKYTHQKLKHKNFEEVQKLYKRENKWIDDFKPINDDSEQQAQSTKKRPRADSKEESSMKQKLEKDNDAEKEELIDSMVIVPRDYVAIDVESLATKYPIGQTCIIRAYGSSKNYKIFSEMLDDFDRQDVIDPHRLVNEIYETTSPEGYDLLLWDQQDYNLISWRLFDSCGVHEFDNEGETVNTATTRVSVVSAPVTTAGVAISTAEPRTPPTTAATVFIDEDLTIAQTLVKMRSEKAKVKGIAFSDVAKTPRLNRSTTTLQPLPTVDPKDKGKGVLVEEEPEKPKKVKRRDQIEGDTELAQRLHKEELAELDRAQKERQKQEEATSAALAKEFDEIQARIDVDHELAVTLTHEEQEKYTIKERAILLAEFFKRRKKQLAAKRAKAIRNKPPTRTQVRNKMISYLKHMGKYTHQQLKHKTFEEIQKLYER
ncbi:hypothetical protein Tco_0916532, partial [Tanacetum coccineum]